MHWKSWMLPLAALAGMAMGCKSSEDGTAPTPKPTAAHVSAQATKPAGDPAVNSAPKPAEKPPEIARSDAPNAAGPEAKPGATPAADPAVKPEARPDEVAPMANGKPLAEIGKLAPNFELVDLDGAKHTLSQYRGKTVVLEWFSPGCPACKYGYSKGPFKTMPEAYRKDGMVWLSVNSEAAENAAAKPKMNRDFVTTYKMEAPILFDPTGVVGRSYGAKSTPHMFVIDPKGVLVYRGAIDNAPGGQTEGGKEMVNYVDAAVADVKAGRAVATAETTSYG